MELRDQLQSALGSAYTIERELSGGGMSRVFVADETALGRKIVAKVLPIEMSAGVSVERFRREIQLAARLQHPHIVPVLTAGELNGLPFYTMPFVKGESLRARLVKSGELSVNDTVHILRDVAAALAYAHGEGVVHRDIKPENVILSGGVAVVTDFGVAKAMDLAASEGGGVSSGLTSLGVALGTPAYMAPEQAIADPHADHRADIYSFGCVAYEMLAGSSPFAGRPPQQLLAAHVTDTPEPLTKRRPNVPAALSALVMKCLEKRAGDRPQSAVELLAALDAIATPSGGMTPTEERLVGVRSTHRRWYAIGTALLALAGVVIVLWSRASVAPTFTVGTTAQVAATPEIEFEPAVSPDGKLVAFASTTSAGTRIFVKQIDGGRPNLLTSDLDGDYSWPRWSPDGSRISFIAKGAIYIMPALGGSPKRTIEGGGSHAWSRDGKQIVFADANGISVRTLDDGASRSVVKGLFLHSPTISPDGQVVAYVEGRKPELRNLSTNAVWVTPLSGGRRIRISDSTHVSLSPVWTADGKSLLFISNVGGTRDVYQQPVRSDGTPVGKQTRMTTALGSFTITLSADGSRMAYDIVRNVSNIWVTQIASGVTSNIASATQVTRENQHIESLSLSHDGKWLAYDSDRNGNFDIYKLRIDGGEPVQLTTNPANDFAPTWSPEDREIAFHTQRNGTRDIYIVNAEGNAEQQVTSGPKQDYSPSWSPDGRGIAYYSEHGGPFTNNISLLSRGAGGGWSVPKGFTPDSVDERNPKWSPDGRLIAFCREGGVAVRAPSGGSTRVLADRGALGAAAQSVAWGRDASTVYASVNRPTGYVLVAIPVAGGHPRVILAEDPRHRLGRWEFAMDGHRLFFTLAAWESDVWVMDLKR